MHFQHTTYLIVDPSLEGTKSSVSGNSISVSLDNTIPIYIENSGMIFVCVCVGVCVCVCVCVCV